MKCIIFPVFKISIDEYNKLGLYNNIPTSPKAINAKTKVRILPDLYLQPEKPKSATSITNELAKIPATQAGAFSAEFADKPKKAEIVIAHAEAPSVATKNHAELARSFSPDPAKIEKPDKVVSIATTINKITNRFT